MAEMVACSPIANWDKSRIVFYVIDNHSYYVTYASESQLTVKWRNWKKQGPVWLALAVLPSLFADVDFGFSA
jgi:hypothetical protein